MRKFKRLIVAVLVICLLSVSLVSASAYSSGKCGANATWTLKGNTLTISGTGDMYDYNGTTAPWSTYSSQIKRVIVGTGITNIGYYAFSGLNKLEDVKISKTVTRIVYGAFLNCSNLDDVVVPKSVVSIGNSAFGRCSSLKKITILNNNCNFNNNNSSIISPTAKIFGYQNSAGHTYAIANNMTIGILPSKCQVERLAGTSRVGTSIVVSDKGWAANGADTVILTNGYNFADALAGGPLSYALDAPIILTSNKSALETDVLNQISKLGAKKVIILGGEGAVNKSIQNQLIAAGYTVERIYGTSRFETAVKIAEKLDEVNGVSSDRVFVAYSHNYPDALAVSSVASITGSPILFAKGDGSIENATASYIKTSGIKEAVILGGHGAVGPAAEGNLAALNVGNPHRIFGTSRYDTAFAIVNTYKDVFVGSTVILATGASFPDALAGGAYAAKCSAPVILVHPTQIANGAPGFITASQPLTAYVLGGQGAVADSTVGLFVK